MKVFDISDNEQELEEFQKVVGNVIAVVFFYMPGCGHCENMKPEWEKFEEVALNRNDDNRVIAKVRSDKMSDVNGSEDIMGFPTILKLENGKKVKEFDDDRTSENLESFLDEPLQKGGKRKIKKSRKVKKSRKTGKSRKIKKSRKTGKSRKMKKSRKTGKSRKMKKSRKVKK